MRCYFVLLLALLGPVLAPSACRAQASGNLLRNGRFQDDWLTLLPKNKNHHWVYFADFYNRRQLQSRLLGPQGQLGVERGRSAGRRAPLILRGPDAGVSQQVNWLAVHDDRVPGGGSPDGGGFPALVPQRSPQAERLVGDLTFRAGCRDRMSLTEQAPCS